MNSNENGDFRDAKILRTSSLFTLHSSLFNDNPSVTACAVPPPFTQGRLIASFHISCGTLIAQAISMKNPIKIGDMRVDFYTLERRGFGQRTK